MGTVTKGRPSGIVSSKSVKSRQNQKEIRKETAALDDDQETEMQHRNTNNDDDDPDDEDDEDEAPKKRKQMATPVFADADAMKEQLKDALIKHVYNVTDFYKTTGPWQAVARSNVFEITTLIVITMNSVWLAVDTDHNDAPVLLKAGTVFQVVEHFFCVYFTFELVVRYMAFERTSRAFRDPNFVFDTLLCTMMVVENWVGTAVLLLFSTGAGSGILANGSVLRLFRMARLTR